MMHQSLRVVGRRFLSWVEEVILVLIAVATVVALLQEIVAMVRALRVDLADLLLLFIYLEVLAMVGIYLESGKLPVRLPLYIGIVALARYLVLDMKAMEPWRILEASGGALLLAAAVLLIRYGHTRLPYTDEAAERPAGGARRSPRRKMS